MPSNISTSRLFLDSFKNEDASRVEELAGDPEVAKGVVGIPHPYPRGAAEDWIRAVSQGHESGTANTWAIRLREGGILVGCVTLFLVSKHCRAEIAFWIGRAYCDKGFATEAASAVVRYAFDQLSLHRIDGGHFAWNLASAAVLRKLGMTQEGVRRGHLLRAGVFEDVVLYGVQRDTPNHPAEPR